MWRNNKFLKYYVIFIFFKQLSLPCLAVSVLYFSLQKTFRNRLCEYSKIRNFVTYQITFLLTYQPHKTIELSLVAHQFGRVLNISFDFFNWACMKKRISNIWDSTNPNQWASKDIRLSTNLTSFSDKVCGFVKSFLADVGYLWNEWIVRYQWLVYSKVQVLYFAKYPPAQKL